MIKGPQNMFETIFDLRQSCGANNALRWSGTKNCVFWSFTKYFRIWACIRCPKTKRFQVFKKFVALFWITFKKPSNSHKLSKNHMVSKKFVRFSSVSKKFSKNVDLEMLMWLAITPWHLPFVKFFECKLKILKTLAKLEFLRMFSLKTLWEHGNFWL